jgi:hypothetical protein
VELDSDDDEEEVAPFLPNLPPLVEPFFLGGIVLAGFSDSNLSDLVDR